MLTEQITRNGLIALAVVGGVSAVGGAVALLGGGIDFPREWLFGSPFNSYVVPGLILGFIVGGSQLIAAWGLIRRAEWGYLAGGLAGCIMIGWILVELLIVGSEPGVMRNLQIACFLLGFLEAVIVAPHVPELTRVNSRREWVIG